VFDADIGSLDEIERMIKLNQPVMKYMTGQQAKKDTRYTREDGEWIPVWLAYESGTDSEGDEESDEGMDEEEDEEIYGEVCPHTLQCK